MQKKWLQRIHDGDGYRYFSSDDAANVVLFFDFVCTNHINVFLLMGGSYENLYLKNTKDTFGAAAKDFWIKTLRNQYVVPECFYNANIKISLDI